MQFEGRENKERFSLNTLEHLYTKKKIIQNMLEI